ncbi:MAG: cell division protein FtsQ/DivIB [Armatimonadota bacterium]|nr:hypothetical protein [Armatimonadota bacterium]MCX7777571.1 hypothetical protein [Armatimonadota bacterium]MDW8025580.1 cell division protein FtsQ/DivIB [Armatimonadota bacterium]
MAQAQEAEFALNTSHTIMRLTVATTLICLAIFIVLITHLRVRHVVFKGAELSSREALNNCRSVLLGRCILFVRRDVSRFFANEPFVAGANARIALPYTVVVELEARKPVGLIRTERGLYAVSGDGLIYKQIEGVLVEGVSELPLFVSERFKGLGIGKRLPKEHFLRLKRILSLLPSVGLSGVGKIELGDANEIKLRMGDGSIIELGGDVGLNKRLALAAAVYTKLRERVGQPIVIDARSMKRCSYRVLK